MAACNAGKCSLDNVQEGTVIQQQTAGDCHVNKCNGQGGITAEIDNTDVHVDGNECTSDLCEAGNPSNPPVSTSVACNNNTGICDSNGQCVECLEASHCGTTTACRIFACNQGACSEGLTPPGTVVANVTAGDCRSDQCDGMGGLNTNAADDTDKPIDNKQCTQDLCVNGQPSNPPEVASVVCNENGGSMCDSTGTCVQCLQPSHCGNDTACKTFTCNQGLCGSNNVMQGTVVSNPTAGDCNTDQCDGNGNIVSAADNTDIPVDGKQCTSDVCTAGIPSNPPVQIGTTCNENGGIKCNGAGSCVQCNVASDCGMDTACKTFTCDQGMCGSTNTPQGTVVANPTTGDCRSDQCDGNGNIAANVMDNNDTPADDGNQCTSDVCTSGMPTHPASPQGTPCSQNGGSVCNGNGMCVTCILDTDCPTGGVCQAPKCNAGVCGFVAASAGNLPPAQQTAGDCQMLACDGTSQSPVSNVHDADIPADDGNQCSAETCTNGMPSHPLLAVGTPCNQNNGMICDSNGFCIGPPSVASTTPADGASVVASTTISVTFSQPMDSATLTGQTTAGACSGTVQVSLDDFASCIAFSSAAATMSVLDSVATFTPAPGLLVNRTYKIRVTTGAKNTSLLPLTAAFTTPTGFTTTSPNLCDGSVVISQLNGGGGNAGAVFKNDFVELHNRGSSMVSLTGMSLQYAGATGSTWTSNPVVLSGDIPPGGYFLVQLSGGTNGVALPTPDLSSTNIAMAGTSGKIALVRGTTQLPAGACPDPSLTVDFVGYGTVNCSEGSSTGTTPAPANSPSLGVIRIQDGCLDFNNNNMMEFQSVTLSASTPPRNSGSPAVVCSCWVLNESGTPLEADYCTTQWPRTLSLTAGSTSELIYGQIWENGVTTPNGSDANPNVRAQLGWGPSNINPQYQSGWTWIDAVFHPQGTNNDEYQATLVAPSAGSYQYLYRMSLDQGTSWTLCDKHEGDNGAGSNAGLTFALQDMAVMTVQ